MKRGSLALVFVMLLAAPLSAQDSPRSGLWGGFGIGGGSIGCDDCIDRTSGFAGQAMIGGTLSDVVRISGGGTFFTREENGATLNIGSGLFIAQVFPGGGDFYLQGGAGFATAEIELEIVTLEDSGAAFLLGLGYNINLGASESLAIAPFANWVPTSISFSPDLFQVGVSLMWN